MAKKPEPKKRINYHLKKVFSDSELQESAVIRNFQITTADRKVQFRKWAGQIVRDYTIQGQMMGVDRLKKGHLFTNEYFDRLLLEFENNRKEDTP